MKVFITCLYTNEIRALIILFVVSKSTSINGIQLEVASGVSSLAPKVHVGRMFFLKIIQL